jgi:hypothetical protein
LFSSPRTGWLFWPAVRSSRSTGREWTITARDTGEVEELLEAALSDWLHFLFVPTPKPFVIYADPDEFITFYANKKSNLSGVVEALSAKGFKVVSDFERVF